MIQYKNVEKELIHKKIDNNYLLSEREIVISRLMADKIANYNKKYSHRVEQKFLMEIGTRFGYTIERVLQVYLKSIRKIRGYT